MTEFMPPTLPTSKEDWKLLYSVNEEVEDWHSAPYGIGDPKLADQLSELKEHVSLTCICSDKERFNNNPTSLRLTGHLRESPESLREEDVSLG